MVVYKMTFLFSSQSENCGVMLRAPSSLFRLSANNSGQKAQKLIAPLSRVLQF